MTMNQEARLYYKRNFYDKNDKAHKIEHADWVYEGMKEVDKKLKLHLDKDVLFMVAYTHDIFTYKDREEHHNLSAEYVLNASDKYLMRFNTHDLKTISDAIREHRSSGDCHYSNDYSLAIQIADRGKPNLKKSILRSYKYNDGKPFDVAVNNVYEHMKDKFSRTGRAFKCDFYIDFYKKEVEEFWDEVDRLTLDDVKRIVLENS